MPTDEYLSNGMKNNRTAPAARNADPVIPPAVRADRWLWSARFYKSRSLAAEACERGKVDVNGQRAKPHKLVRVHDTIVLTHAHGPKTLKVLAVTDKRGPAAQARLLYEDQSPPRPDRPNDDFRLVIDNRPLRLRGSGRPTKRERRETEWLRGR